MAKRYKFDKDYTYVVRDGKGVHTIELIEYKAGYEGLIPEDHITGAEAAKAGSVVNTGPSSEGNKDADSPGGSRDVH